MYSDHLQLALSGILATLGGDQERATQALDRYEQEYLTLSTHNRAAVDLKLNNVLSGLIRLQTRFAEQDDWAPYFSVCDGHD